jgi:hypothetical protein
VIKQEPSDRAETNEAVSIAGDDIWDKEKLNKTEVEQFLRAKHSSSSVASYFRGPKRNPKKSPRYRSIPSIMT